MKYLPLLVILLASCRLYQPLFVNESPQVPCVNESVQIQEEMSPLSPSPIEQQVQSTLPQWVVLSKGAVELWDQNENRSLSIDDQLVAERSTFAFLKVGKDAWLNNCRVNENLTVGGEGRFYKSNVGGTVKVEGDIYAQCSTFAQIVDSNGDVTAVDTVFNDLLQAKAEIIDLTNVQAETIFIKATGPYYDKQLVYLKGNTLIKGDIIFESERGRVICNNGCVVYGCILGGRKIQSYENERIRIQNGWR